MSDEPRQDDQNQERQARCGGHADGADPACLCTSVANTRDDIARAESYLVDQAKRFGYEHASRFALRLAFEEAITNALRHGHCDLPDSEPVDVSIEVDHRRVRIVIEDHGPGFEPGCIDDPTLDENLDKPSGRGLMLIRAYMTSVSYNKAGNRVEMIYEKPGDSGPQLDPTAPPAT